MSGFLIGFWNKQPPPTGAMVEAPIGGKNQLKKLQNVAGAGNIANLVSAYENINPANDLNCSQRMTALQSLDTAIYNWFTNNPTPALKSLNGAKDMEKLMRKSEQAHERLVEATKDDANVVPFDTSNMSQQEITDRTNVWRSLVDGTAAVSIGGSDKFQANTRAKMGKLLQTQTGFDILNYLSTSQNNPANDSERIVLSDKLPQDIAQIPHIVQEHQDVSYANDLATDRTRKNLIGPVDAAGNEDPNEFPTLHGSDEVQQAIFDKKRGYILNGKKYTFGTGSGAYVTTVPPRAGDEHSDTAGLNGTQIPTPTFITLGHELGHAVNIRAGAVTRLDTDLMTSLCQLQDPTLTAQDVTDNWSNSEEYLVINNIENTLRQENGVPQRSSHKDLSVLGKMATLKQLDARAGQLSQRDQAINDIPEVGEFSQWFQQAKKSVDNPKVVTQIEKRLGRLEKLCSVGYVEKFKVEDLKQRYTTLQVAYNPKKALLAQPDNNQLLQLYTNITAVMNDRGNLGLACKEGTPGYQTLRDDMRNLRFAIQNLN